MVEKASGPQIRLMVLASRSSEALIGVLSQGWWEMMPEWDTRVVVMLLPRRGDAAASAAWVDIDAAAAAWGEMGGGLGARRSSDEGRRRRSGESGATHGRMSSMPAGSLLPYSSDDADAPAWRAAGSRRCSSSKRCCCCCCSCGRLPELYRLAVSCTMGVSANCSSCRAELPAAWGALDVAGSSVAMWLPWPVPTAEGCSIGVSANCNSCRAELPGDEAKDSGTPAVAIMVRFAAWCTVLLALQR